ncbi:MAG: cysteine synthase A [Planctomycetota bacterium]|nr:MAG: cysteine synthase A [Planctomycetota bacterium]
MKIAKDLLDLIGNTPLIELSKFSEGAGAQVLGKCEFFNPYSIKDRAVSSIILQAESRGDIKPGGTLIEATSGNTGMALASIGRRKGYKVLICMSEIQSVERRNILKALGAELFLTPAELGTKAAKEKAMALSEEIPNSYYVGQHNNLDNRLAHARTSNELWEDTDGKIDIFIAGMGTCGTLCGVSENIKKRKPSIRIIGVEPAEAPILSKGEWQPHRMMGTAPGFIPKILDRELIDEMYGVPTEKAFETCRVIAQKEGLLVGISSGACAYLALELAMKEENKGKCIVCVFADSGERYLSVKGLFSE